LGDEGVSQEIIGKKGVVGLGKVGRFEDGELPPNESKKTFSWRAFCALGGQLPVETASLIMSIVLHLLSSEKSKL
jgi:hypothetical protein